MDDPVHDLENQGQLLVGVFLSVTKRVEPY